MESTINERLLEWVSDYGGPAKMATELGLTNPQLFYNLKNRPDSKPNSNTVDKVIALIPNANLNWLYKGTGYKYLNSEGAELVRAVPAPVAPDDAGLMQKQANRIEKLENVNNELMGRMLQITHPELFSDKEGIKADQDSHITDHLPAYRQAIG